MKTSRIKQISAAIFVLGTTATIVFMVMVCQVETVETPEAVASRSTTATFIEAAKNFKDILEKNEQGAKGDNTIKKTESLIALATILKEEYTNSDEITKYEKDTIRYDNEKTFWFRYLVASMAITFIALFALCLPMFVKGSNANEHSH